MKTSILATSLLSTIALAQVTGQLGDAEVTHNPVGVSYTAVLPDRPNTKIRGEITGTSNANGTGVFWHVDFYGFPDPSLGPFLYHIHDQPIPASGNCTAALAHLDPYIRGEQPPCDPTKPQTCQVGDLSGKYGNITADSNGEFETSYLDLFTSTIQGPASFFGNRSIVVHTANTTRLTCANFELVSESHNSTDSANVGSSNSTPTSPPLPTFTGAASQSLVSTAAILAGLLAFAL